VNDFSQFGLTAAILRSLEDLGFEEPTPVQARALPILLAGRDMVAQALTGTGKTAAFGIPLIERIDVDKDNIQAVVLTPTRELAVQVAEHLSRLGHHGGLRLLPIYGGQPISRQLRSLDRGVHVVVATPGRLIDHINRRSIDLSHVRTLVLDEADQMLAMGFQEDVELILAAVPAERTTALFSATMPKPILEIVGRYMRDPEMVHLSTRAALTVPTVSQVYHEVPFPRKADALRRILDAKQPERTMVFCATKRTVDDVCEQLQGHGYQAEALHGDISQPAREKVLRGFKQGRSEVLVATDVAARGLDIPEVSLVINFDIPPDPEYYVHRIGRTARLGRAGEAVTFINPRELRELKLIERATGAVIRRAELPTAADGVTRERQTLDERLRQMLATDGWSRFKSVVEGLSEEFEPADVAAAALALAAGGKSLTAPKPPVSSPSESMRPAGNEHRTHDESRSEARPQSRQHRKGRPPARPFATSPRSNAEKKQQKARRTSDVYLARPGRTTSR
jgi:ATP-dependent RNA helicase DeaD